MSVESRRLVGKLDAKCSSSLSETGCPVSYRRKARSLSATAEALCQGCSVCGISLRVLSSILARGLPNLHRMKAVPVGHRRPCPTESPLAIFSLLSNSHHPHDQPAMSSPRLHPPLPPLPLLTPTTITHPSLGTLTGSLLTDAITSQPLCKRFTAVPYAQTPVRWKRAQPLDFGGGYRYGSKGETYDEWGAVCPQVRRLMQGGGGHGEDELKLTWTGFDLLTMSRESTHCTTTGRTLTRGLQIRQPSTPRSVHLHTHLRSPVELARGQLTSSPAVFHLITRPGLPPTQHLDARRRPTRGRAMAGLVLHPSVPGTELAKREKGGGTRRVKLTFPLLSFASSDGGWLQVGQNNQGRRYDPSYMIGEGVLKVRPCHPHG